MTEATPEVFAPTARSEAWSRLATERGLFTSAVTVVGLHVVDDSFLQPEPGTSAADHLVSGLVPVALLAVAAYGYPRLRAGARAALALGIGILAMVIGSASGVYSALATGPSGDDFTGLLAVLAGLALVILGIVLLWRSRRREGSLLRRIGRRTLLGVAGLLVAYGLVFPIGLGYVTTHVLRPTVPSPSSARRMRTSRSSRATACDSKAGTSRRRTAPP